MGKYRTQIYIEGTRKTYPGFKREEFRCYTNWRGMMARCYHKSNIAYSKYGGRGITVCDRWKDFKNFLEDMGECPIGLSIDRIDGERGYEPSNCRWATDTQQMRNIKWNLMIKFKGQSRCASDWAEYLGIHRATLCSRLRYGWTIEQALTTPVEIRNGINDHKPPIKTI